MKILVTAGFATLCLVAPAFAGGNSHTVITHHGPSGSVVVTHGWHGGYYHSGYWRSSRWYGGGIGPGAAVALGLGAFALGAFATAPFYGWSGYAPPVAPVFTYPYGPYGPRFCTNGVQTWQC